MYRIGILGTENSHAMAFAEIFNGIKPIPGVDLSDMRVVAVGGDYPDESRKVCEKCGVEHLVEQPGDMLGMVDAVMVTARDGRRHEAFARPFIEAGIPAFIDKPFTSDPEQAVQLARLAKTLGVPLTGGSSVRICGDALAVREYAANAAGKILSANMAAPVDMDNPYGNFWFYSAHLAETVLSVFGQEPEWVWASRGNGVSAIIHYPEYEVTCNYNPHAYHYVISIYTREEAYIRRLSLDDAYSHECISFANMLRSGKMECSYDDLVRPVYCIAALERSFETGEKQFIPKVSI